MINLQRPVALPVRTILLFLIVLPFVVSAQSQAPDSGIYEQIKAFQLSGGKAELSNVTFKRDRVTMTLNGTVYFSAPAARKVTGAVFVGRGTFTAQAPPSDFERANLKRFLKSEAVTSDFTSATMLFSDDTFDVLGKTKVEAAAPSDAQKLASGLIPRVLEETGSNLASRVTQSILNSEGGGFFFANFDGGSAGRFSYVFDKLGRIPTADFNINGGEKGLIYAYRDYSNDVWMAFYSEQDYARGIVPYSDFFDLVDTEHYRMEVDLRTPKSKMAVRSNIRIKARFDGVSAESGDVTQEGVPEDFFMPLPLVFTLPGGKFAAGTVHAFGPKTPFQIKLAVKPAKVELDPYRWVLSEKTETK